MRGRVLRWAFFVLAAVVLVGSLTGIGVLVFYARADERLVTAIERGDLEAVQREIARGADVNRTRDIQVPAQPHPDMVEPVPGYTIVGVTPLMRAAWSPDEGIVEALLAADADVTAATGDGETALHYAAATPGSEAVIRQLIEGGADVNALAHGGRWPPVLSAVHSGDAVAVEALVEAGAVVDCGGWSMTMLHIAARTTDSRKVQAMLGAGVSVDARDSAGMTPLMWACRPGGSAVVEMLLEAGADVNAQDRDDQTALMHASQDLEVGNLVERLLKAGAVVDARDGEGRTALMHAIEIGSIEAVTQLVAAGGDVNARDGKGRTPLMFVSRHGYATELVDVLLKAGADLNAVDDAGTGVWLHARLRGASAETLERLEPIASQE